MARRRKIRQPLSIGGAEIEPGETQDVRLKVSESYAGDPLAMVLRVIRAERPGPTVFVTAAVHGDELNGTGIIRELMIGRPPPLVAGTLICVPVVNVFGFETHDRYLPDRRDLNRSFPGADSGSLASRLAAILFSELVLKCDFGIDLHTAAVRRTNFPNIRADLADPGVRRLAHSFGCELIVNDRGPLNTLRREATRAGCPTIILEAGEVWKIEPGVVEMGVRGVDNVLIELGMMEGDPVRPLYQTRIDRTTWVRAEVGGILRFFVAPGDVVEAGQPLAANMSLFGDARSILIAPADGIILGMTTLPAVKPGEPVVHIATPKRSARSIRRSMQGMPRDALYQQIRRQLATSVSVHQYDDEDASGLS